MSMPAEKVTDVHTLDALLEGIAAAPAIAIDDLAIDSRRVVRGSLFLAVAGATHHGLQFGEKAVEAGAAAIAWDSDTADAVPEDIGIPAIAVPGLAGKLGEIADRFFGQPSRDLQVIGVTGTNGKTTVAWLIAQCFEVLGASCGYAGTLGYGVGELTNDDEMTSPDVIEMHRRLAQFRDAGANYAAVEVSSHALDQHRVDAVRFDSTLFTNLSRDHLDYHGDMLAYGEAKAKLFTEHKATRRVINLDTEFGTDLASRCHGDVITVSTKFDRVANGRPFVFVRSVVAKEYGSDVKLQSSWGDAEFSVPLPGDYNVANAVLVLAYLLACGVGLEDACDAILRVTAPPGRMQMVPAPTGPAVYIDYAHSPEALESALRALRAHCRGQLWCVFGCGGERDAGKRPIMGRIAERLADRFVITNDNPRGEAPEAIFEDIVAGLKDASKAHVIEDRAAAIGWAIKTAAPTDLVLIAGKGHEDYQILGDGRVDFSDFAVAAATLSGVSE